MTTKLLEVRDSMTRISVLAIRFDPADAIERAIFGQNWYGTNIDDQSRYVVVVRLNDLEARYAADDWPTGTRTMTLAHQHILAHFNELETGDVVDVEFEQGWKPDKKRAEWRDMLAAGQLLRLGSRQWD